MRMAIRLSRLRGGMLVALAVAVVFGFSVGMFYSATSAPSSNTIDVCVNRYNGDMRMARSPGRCASTEFAVQIKSYAAANLDDEYVNEGQPDSIRSEMITDGEVKNDDLADDVVTSDKILDGAVRPEDIHPELETFIDDQSIGSGWHIVEQTKQLGAGAKNDVEVECPAGQRVLGGGGDVKVFGVYLLASRPLTLDPLRSLYAWEAAYDNTTDQPVTITVYAICAHP